MPFKLNKDELTKSMPLKKWQDIIPDYDHNDEHIEVDEACTTTAIVAIDTNYAVVASDGNELKEVITAANGLLGEYTDAQPSPATLVRGLSLAVDTVSKIIETKPQSNLQEIKFRLHPCEETEGETSEERARKSYKISMEVFGAWVVSDDEARHDVDEYARVQLLLSANGKSEPWVGSHAKRSTEAYSFPFYGRSKTKQHFRVELETGPAKLPLTVYSKCTISAKTDGPGNSALNPLDWIEDAFTSSVSAVRIDRIEYVINEVK